MTLIGLPEGVEAVAIRVPKQGEPILVVDGNIVPSPSNHHGLKRLVLRMLPGYELLFNIETNTWDVKRMAVPPVRVLRATFLVGSDSEERDVRSYLAHAPGMVGITEEQKSEETSGHTE